MAFYTTSICNDTLSSRAYARIRSQRLSICLTGPTIASMDDFDVARKHLDSLKELFLRHSGEADARALRCLIALCRAAQLSTDDDYCRAKITAVEEQGAEMFTHGGHRRFSADFLRQRILDALELLESRLYSLAMLRSPGEAASSSVARFEIHPV